MTRHASRREYSLIAVTVCAPAILDLRSPDVLAAARSHAGDPFADWQEAVASGETPTSWRVRDWAEVHGAAGMIDPSRTAPGLWHLVLFRWNMDGAPRVERLAND